MSSSNALPWAALGSVIGSIAVVLLTRLFTNLAARRDERRREYSDAVQTVFAWVEMVYRVRRRDPSALFPLVARFHDLEERLVYYEALNGRRVRSSCLLLLALPR